VRFIRQAWLDHGVVFFRDQSLDIEQMKRFAGYFGRLAPDNGHAFFRGADPDQHKARQFIENFGTAAGDVTGATDVVAYMTRPPKPAATGRAIRTTDLWHSDTTGVAQPPMATVLRAVTLPSVGGDTLWSSMYAAYDALSPAFRTFLGGLSATHTMMGVFDRKGEQVPFSDADVEVIHPVVLVHPETGRKALYVNESWTTRIIELDPAESAHVLAILFEHVNSPDFFLRWHWSPNDIAFWDNRAVQHYAVHDYDEKREMQRIIVA
jgi:alpha-ketoglutarate-dependent taurine dioxygenase